MYYGPYTKIKSIDEGLSVFGQLFICFSIMFVLLHVWALYISKPIELSSLDEIEGVIIEKSFSTYKGTKQFKFRIKTNKGMKIYRAHQDISRACCDISSIPTNVKINAFTKWSWVNGLQLYQIRHKQKLVFNVIGTPKEKRQVKDMDAHYARAHAGGVISTTSTY